MQIKIYATGCQIKGPIALRHILSNILPYLVIYIYTLQYFENAVNPITKSCYCYKQKQLKL